MATVAETLKAGEHFLDLLTKTPHQNPRALLDSDFGVCLEELWDIVHIDPHQNTGIRELNLPDELRNKITSELHSRAPREPVTVFGLTHFPQDYEGALTAGERQAVRHALRKFGVLNPYREDRLKRG